MKSFDYIVRRASGSTRTLLAARWFDDLTERWRRDAFSTLLTKSFFDHDPNCPHSVRVNRFGVHIKKEHPSFDTGYGFTFTPTSFKSLGHFDFISSQGESFSKSLGISSDLYLTTKNHLIQHQQNSVIPFNEKSTISFKIDFPKQSAAFNENAKIFVNGWVAWPNLKNVNSQGIEMNVDLPAPGVYFVPYLMPDIILNHCIQNTYFDRIVVDCMRNSDYSDSCPGSIRGSGYEDGRDQEHFLDSNQTLTITYHIRDKNDDCHNLRHLEQTYLPDKNFTVFISKIVR